MPVRRRTRPAARLCASCLCVLRVQCMTRLLAGVTTVEAHIARRLTAAFRAEQREVVRRGDLLNESSLKEDMRAAVNGRHRYIPAHFRDSDSESERPCKALRPRRASPGCRPTAGTWTRGSRYCRTRRIRPWLARERRTRGWPPAISQLVSHARESILRSGNRCCPSGSCCEPARE